MADITGRRLGNYRLVRHLGHGGFAEVYLGEHLYLKSEAALKVLLTSPTDEDVELFRQEAQTLVGLRHPNIVRVLEFGVEGAITFLVLDYAPGGTARHRYPTGTRLPLATTVAYVKQVAAALQYAHNRGIIHRDIKPENILLDFDQHILLSDFGLALFAPTPELLSTQKGSGTAPYMPPEQLQGKPTFASDQYALAVVAYEWLCGKRPFEGDIWALFHQHLYVAPPPLRQLCPDVPAAVEEVILRALAKDPHQRFSSIQAFTLALERASHLYAAALDVDSQITAPLKSTLPSSEVTPTAMKHSRYGPAAQRRVFLTAAPADAAFAARLHADLEARGISIAQERFTDTPDAHQHDALRQVIREAPIALVVVSPQTRSSRTVKEQLRIISMYQRHLVFVWAAGGDLASVLPEAWGRTAMIDLVDAREARYQVALDEIIAFLEAATSTGTPEESTLPVPAGDPRNPYKGLRAFTREDATDFFGRDALIEELAETLEGLLTAEQHNVPASRLLTVIGPSGSGKSSVVMAGLLPGLQRGALSGSEAWVYLDPIVPGQRPLESLMLAFAPHLPERSVRSIREDLADDAARGLHLLATQLVRRAGVKVVLMIDQFEELFTQTVSERERQQVIDLLVAAVTEPAGPLVVLVTLRADFYDRPMHYLHLSQLIEAHQRSVLPMNLRDLRAVIEQPAALPDVQLLFEGELVGDLLFEAQGQVGALPLLEFTLDQLFQERDGHWLTRKAYRQIGGVKGALAKHAESTYASLPSDEHRRLARALFLRLIDPGVTEQDTTRRRAVLSELILDDPIQTRLLQETVDIFIAARLLTTNEIAGRITIEVSHEALIREWKRLAEWLREAREDITLQQAISADAAEWERRSMPRDRLYRGSQLKEASAWAKRNVPSRQEVAFLQASTRRRVRSTLSVVIVALLFLSTTGLTSWFLLHQPADPTRVTTSADAGIGSLRWAIESAPAKSTITFDTSLRKSVILLTSNDLTFTKSMTIRGPGAPSLAISGGKSGHIVRVLSGVTVAIFDLGFINSNTGQTGVGFIENEGTLTLTNSIVSGNRSSNLGGGIYNNGGNLTLVNSIVSRNSAPEGGGIYNDTMSELTLIRSTISENMASDAGGGIYDYEGRNHQSILISCTIRGNTAHNGGGIFVDGGHPLETRNSHITGNHAPTHPDVAGNIVPSQ